MFIDQLPDIREVRDTHGRTARDQKGINYVIYCRKSDERDGRTSIPDQIVQCMNLAQREGLNVIGIVQEQMSARHHGRPKFTNLLNAIKGKEELRYLEPQ